MNALFLLVVFLGLVGCAPAVNPYANQSAPNPAALEAVRMERNVIAGFKSPGTPDALNNAVFLRYRSSQPVAPRAVVVLMPGFLGGAGNFDRLARMVVAQDAALEVWAVDRRSNQLEDHSRMLEANGKRDPMIAWRYYVRDAGTAAGFRPREARDIAFMGRWGLHTHLEDLRAVIRQARTVAPKVFLGGHSLGSVMVTLYAGWDFDGTPGANDLSGLILLDGAAGRTVSSENPQLERDYLEGQTGPLGIRTAGVNELESGTAPPYFEALGFGPAGLAKYGAAGLLAKFDPQGDSPGGFVPYPASNLAAGLLAGVGGDDDFAPITAFSVSLGFADARLGLSAFGLLLGGGLRVGEVIGPKDGARRVEWIMPAPNDPKELTDPTDFVQRFWQPFGGTGVDYQEWYFPARLSLDIAAVGLEAPAWAVTRGLRLTRLSEVRLPFLVAAGGRGIVTDPGSFKPLERKLGRALEVRTLPGMTHLDVLSARVNPLAGWIVEYAR
jgi:hypothetical protein